MKRFTKLFVVLISAMLFSHCAEAQKDKTTTVAVNNIIELKIKPSTTDASITATDVPHLVMYDEAKPVGKLFLFLPGTNGIPERGPKVLFRTAIEQGYRVINLSYINKQAVARICRGENLANDIDCTEKFRTQRVFGDQLMSLIPDQPQDAIVPRLTKLLVHLNESDPDGQWSTYLTDGAVNWKNVTVTGQSQGGGMSAFIAKRHIVNRIITFSGGWDYSAVGKIAKWYSNESITPPALWHGTYHQKEPKATTIDETYRALNIPDGQIYALDRKVREGRKAHGEAIRNTVYKDLWIKLLGDGHLD